MNLTLKNAARAIHWNCSMPPQLTNQILRVMRLTAFIILICCMHVSASGLSQNVSFSGKKMALVEVFAAIKKQTGYVVFCSKESLEKTRPVSLNVQNIPLVTFLELLLKDQPLDYLMGDNTISLFPKKTTTVAISTDVADIVSMFVPIKGRVSDEEGNPVPGVSVMIKGSQQGTTTDAEGRFTLNGEAGQTIVISSVEFDTKEVKIADEYGVGKPINIRLVRSVTSLNEITVNKGYYTQSRLTNVGNVTTITAKEIEKQPVSNILEALVGRINGLEIFPRTGIPGATPAMLIRGISSWGTIASGNSSNPPLIVLDGVPLAPSMLISNSGSPWGSGGNVLNNLLALNPMDVETIDVLKDGDATAIYGSRGANGVILITTKRGKGNRVRTNLNASTGFQKVPHFIDLLNNKDYRAMRREAIAMDKAVPNASNAPDLVTWDSTNVHDWQRELLGGTAKMNDITLSVSGGSGTTHFYVSSSYHEQGTVMPGNSKFRRGAFNASLNYLSQNNKLSFDVLTSYGLSDINLLSSDVASFILFAPNYPVFKKNNPDSLDWSGGAGNPYAATRQKYAAPSKTYSGSVQFGYEVFKGLKLKARAAYNTNNTRVSWQQPLNSQNPESSQSIAKLNLQNGDATNWSVDPYAEFSRNFNKHHLNAVAGGTFNKQMQRGLQISGSGFSSDRMVGDISAATTIDRPSVSETPYAYGSFYSRLGYDFDQKYLANLTFRRDGSTRFGPGKKFGNFGSVGLGWVFSQENWFSESVPFISFGKLRASYGTTGGDNIPGYAYIPYFTSNGTYNGAALLPANIDNPELHWEVVKKLEVGMELGLFDNRISVSGAYFRNRATDGIMYVVIAPLVPFNYITGNYPSLLQNTGWEIQLSTKNLRGKFSWNTNLNLSSSGGKLLRFDNFEMFSYSFNNQLGQSLTIIRNGQSDSLKNTGDISVINTSGKTRLSSGDRDPFFGSMTNEFSYKNFSLSLLIQFNRQRGYPTYIPTKSPGTSNYNITPYASGRWQHKGDELKTNIPRYGNNLANYTNYIESNMFTETSYVFRLGNVAFSYTLPENLIKRLRMTRLQLFCNAQNLYVFDKYKNWRLDPTTGNTALPPLRTFVFGINAGL